MENEERFKIEAEGVLYEQEPLSSAAGMKLMLLVAKTGFEPMLETAADLFAEDDMTTALRKVQGDASLQAGLLKGLATLIYKLTFEDIEELKSLLFSSTFLQKPNSPEKEVRLDIIAHTHFRTINDNARLLVLLFKSCQVQLAPLSRAQCISHLLAMVQN